MPRSMVGRLTAVGTAMSALAGPAHGDIVRITIADAAVATSLVVYAPASFSNSPYVYGVIHLRTRRLLATGNCQSGPARHPAAYLSVANLPAAGMPDGWAAASHSPGRSRRERAGSGLTLSARVHKLQAEGQDNAELAAASERLIRRCARWPPPGLPPGRRFPAASAPSARQPRLTTEPYWSKSELQRPGAVTKTSTNGTQQPPGADAATAVAVPPELPVWSST